MKLALVMGPCPSGECGVGDYTRRLASSLTSLGLDVELICEGPWGLLDVRRASRSLYKLKPDIVHIQYPTAGFGHRLGPQLLALKRRTVITLHEASQAHLLRKLSLYPFSVRAQHLIFPSEYERQFAEKWAPWITHRSSVIPVGSNIEAAPNGGNRRYDEVAYFGLIAPRKGLEEVLGLAKLVHSSGFQLKIRIIGKTSAQYETYSAQLRLQSHGLPVIWQSDLSHEEVAKELAGCSIAYLPFPDGASERRASLKAMLSSGVVTITTRGAHTPSDLEGVVKVSNSPKDAYDHIRVLVNDPLEQEKLRRTAIEYMRQFSWDRIVDLHLRVYESLAQLGVLHKPQLRDGGGIRSTTGTVKSQETI
jgi:glycosyltransferase involved in cell wall biosynthesis